MAELSEQPAQIASRVDWRNRKGWETAHIRSEAKSGLLKMWLFAGIWNLVSLPLLFVFAEEWAQGNYLVLIGLIFPLVGAVLLYKAILLALEYGHFGKVVLEMDPYPGAIGGNVGGRVHLENWPASGAMDSRVQAMVRLECVYSYISGSGKNRSRRENIEWAEEGEPGAKRTGTGLNLLFRFHIPDKLPEADADQSGAYHFWRLSVKAQRRGVDLDRKYNIPVFHTGESSRYVDHDISDQAARKKELESKAIREAVAAGNFDLPGYSRAMRLTDLGGELRLVFPMFRNKVLTIFAAIFAGGFGYASYSMLRGLWGDGLFGIFMGFLSIPFVLVALAAAVAAIYLPLNNLRVSIEHNQVTTLRRLLFIPVYYRRLARSSIEHLLLKRSGTTGQGVDRIEHFKVLARLKGGGSLILAEDIDGEDAAGHLRDFLARRLHLPTGPQ